MHDLSFANLDECLHAPTSSRQRAKQPAPAMAAGGSASPLCLFRSQRSREPGCGLCELSWPHRPNGHDLSGHENDHVVVPGLSSASRKPVGSNVASDSIVSRSSCEQPCRLAPALPPFPYRTGEIPADQLHGLSPVKILQRCLLNLHQSQISG